MKIKSKDIAKALGLSTATVSLAINDRPGVNPNTRQEVLNYIRQKQTQDSEEKQVQKSVAMIVLIRDMNNREADDGNLFNISYQEVYRVLLEEGYNLNLIYWDYSKDTLDAIVERCRYNQVSGILMCAYAMEDEDFKCLEKSDFPLVILDHEHFCSSADNVMFDNRGAVSQGLDYLYKMGHEKIAYFSNSEDVRNFWERKEACHTYSVPKDCKGQAPLFVEIGSEMMEVYQNTKKFLQNTKPLPTAIMTENYKISLGVLRACLDSGYKIGEDISVLGIDELPESAFFDFDFTHVSMLHKNKAKIAAKRLIYRMEHACPGENIVVYVRNQFVEGESVKHNM